MVLLNVCSLPARQNFLKPSGNALLRSRRRRRRSGSRDNGVLLLQSVIIIWSHLNCLLPKSALILNRLVEHSVRGPSCLESKRDRHSYFGHGLRRNARVIGGHRYKNFLAEGKGREPALNAWLLTLVRASYFCRWVCVWYFVSK